MINSRDKEVLEVLLRYSPEPDNPLPVLPLSDNGQLITLQSGSVLIRRQQPLDDYYFLLKGRLSVWNLLLQTRDEFIDYLWPLDVLGLVERLNDENEFSAYVMADCPSVVYRMPVSIVEEILKTDGVLCYQLLRVLGKVTAYNMLASEKKSSLSSKDTLGHYLYCESVRSSSTIYVCGLTRAELAEYLHMNLRTLYRHIASLKEVNLVSIVDNRITINEEQRDALIRYYSTIIL